MALKRRPLSQKKSNSIFRKGTKVNRKNQNVTRLPMRGGIRL